MRALIAALFVATLAGDAQAQDHDPCDNKIEVEKGERAGGPFFGTGMLMGVLATAEKLCGAKGLDWEQAFSRYVVANGCPVHSPIGKQIIADARKVRSVTLAMLLSDGKATFVSPEQIAEAKRGIEQEMGGCAKLIETYDTFVKREAARATE